MNGNDRKGFTLVEAIVAIVAIAALLAIFIPVMRERERQRLQALAESEPWEVFELRAAPAKKSFVLGEDIAILCEIVNPTNFPLRPPKDLGRVFLLLEEDRDYFFDVQLNDASPFSRDILGPGESVKFEALFYPVGVGAAEASLVYLADKGWRVTIRWSMAIIDQQGRLVNRKRNGVLPPGEKRLQSNAFRLVIEESDYPWPTFEEVFAEIPAPE